MNTAVLSESISAHIPSVANFSKTKLQDSVLLKRYTYKCPSAYQGNFSPTGSNKILFRLNGMRAMADFSALRVQFNLQITGQAGGDNNIPASCYIQDGLGGIFRSVKVTCNSVPVENIQQNYSLISNNFYYYSAHDSYMRTQAVKSGFHEYGAYPSPPAVSANGQANAPLANPLSDTFSMPLSMLGISRSKTLFPLALCNSFEVEIELNPAAQVLYQFCKYTAAVQGGAAASWTGGSVNISACPATVTYQLNQGSVNMFFDVVEVSSDYLEALIKQPSFSYVIDSFDHQIITFLGATLNNLTIQEPKKKLKALYCLIKDFTQTFSNVLVNPGLRSYSLQIGNEQYPSQRVGGLNSGKDCDILSNNMAMYDELLNSFSELQNVLSMGVLPFKNSTVPYPSGNPPANGTIVPVAPPAAQPFYGGKGCYFGDKFMLNFNLESNLASLLSGVDSASAGGNISINLETENTLQALNGGNVINAQFICFSNFDEMLVWEGEGNTKTFSVRA